MQFLVNVNEKSIALVARAQPIRQACQPIGRRSLAPRQGKARHVLPTPTHWGRRQDATQSILCTLGFGTRALFYFFRNQSSSQVCL